MGEIAFGKWALALALTHGLIDLMKLHFQKNKTKRLWFAIDQVLHLLILLGIAFLSTSKNSALRFRQSILDYHRNGRAFINQTHIDSHQKQHLDLDTRRAQQKRKFIRKRRKLYRNTRTLICVLFYSHRTF